MTLAMQYDSCGQYAMTIAAHYKMQRHILQRENANLLMSLIYYIVFFRFRDCFLL